ncbi:MAG: hypothetical protein DMG25_13355 [Acidobacteria bacterium]|nr:MAG: hypothetical protein DMG25_13355 [Acidobacteriota bacterium]
MRRKAFLTLTTLVLVQLFTATIAWATDYYVSRTGSDVAGDGSRERPWFTVTHADRSKKLQPGDTIHVAPGTYTGPWRTWSTSGSAAAPITYISNQKWGAVLKGESGSVWSNKADYIRIIGFQIVGNATGHSLNGIYTQGSHTVIQGNWVHGVLNGPYSTTTCNTVGGAGIHLDGPYAQVIGNYVDNNGPHDASGNPAYCNYVHGIYFLQPGGVAANNISFNNSGWGIQMWHFASNEVINNNTIFNNGVGCIVVGASGGATNDHTVVDNNICYKTHRGIGERGTYGPGQYATGTHNIYSNNLLYQNSTYEISLQTGTASDTVSADPQFVKYTGDSSGDYHLSSSSPAIDAGLPSDTIPGSRTVGFITRDFHGVARPQGCCFDLGADEYVF